jgi:hypothetical protein
MNDILAFMVTSLGIVLCLTLLAILLLGKKIDSGADGAQEIQVAGMKAKTSVVIMFLLLSLVPALLPMWLRAEADKDHGRHARGDPMYETWTVRGQIIADEVQETKTTLHPPATRLEIDAHGWFRSDIPVQRTSDGKLHFPSFIIEHPAYREHVPLDLDGFQHGLMLGARDFKPKFIKDKKWIVLEKPIEMAPTKKSDATPTPGVGGK